MTEYYLAVDIGASGGRHILGHMENGRLVMEEIHRFPNGLVTSNGEACWDTEQLFAEIKTGMKKCREAGKIPVSIGIDTWAVDFVLLDKKNNIIGNAAGYRDKRTDHMDEKIARIIPENLLYKKTGIQKQLFNTIYQLMAVKTFHPDHLERAESMLLIPDYFHFLLTGKKASEYTNATTTQLLNPETGTWNQELIHMMGFPAHIFQPVAEPGTVLGSLTADIQTEVGFDCLVTLPVTHDTGSAVMAVPSREENVIYISSGTWSLMGVERNRADCSEYSRIHNFTNEGGYNHRFRYLKNIMGLWMIQSLRRELDSRYSFAELCSMAEAESIPSIVDCNDSRFLAPDSMRKAIVCYCLESGQQVPETPAQFARVIYRSLACCYAKTVKEIEEATGRTYPCIHIIGGGSHADYLNRLTAAVCLKKVYAGPPEATAAGNLMAQIISRGGLADLNAARKCIA